MTTTTTTTTTSDSGWVRDVEGPDFDRLVVARSATVPVVVDFWASWCAPCRALGPVLEHEVNALGGRVELAKLDVDANQGLAAEFGVRGIPAVKAFVGGRVVAEFEGARPATFVRSWLAALAPSEAKQALAAAEQALAGGDAGGAEAVLRPLLDQPEVASRAAALLARALLDRGAIDEVPALFGRIDPRSEEADRIPHLERRLQFVADAAAFGGEEAARAALARDESDLEARYALGSALAARGDTAGALEEFLSLVGRSRKFKDDGARVAMLALLQELGPDSDVARDFRRRLQILI